MNNTSLALFFFHPKACACLQTELKCSICNDFSNGFMGIASENKSKLFINFLKDMK